MVTCYERHLRGIAYYDWTYPNCRQEVHTAYYCITEMGETMCNRCFMSVCLVVCKYKPEFNWSKEGF
jgi:hypothetical protein